MIIKPCVCLFSDIYLTWIYARVTVPRLSESCFADSHVVSAPWLHMCMGLLEVPGELPRCQGHHGCRKEVCSKGGAVLASWPPWRFIIANLLMCDGQMWNDVITTQKLGQFLYRLSQDISVFWDQVPAPDPREHRQLKPQRDPVHGARPSALLCSGWPRALF